MKKAYQNILLVILLTSSSVCYSQQNINSSSVEFIGTKHSVNAIIGDTFLGNVKSTSFSIQHSILSASNEIILGFAAKNSIELKAYPNPFTNTFKIQFQSQSNYEIIIINTTGSEVKRVKTTSDINLKLDAIPKGIYLVKVVDKKHNTNNVFEVIKL